MWTPWFSPQHVADIKMDVHPPNSMHFSLEVLTQSHVKPLDFRAFYCQIP